MDKKKIIKILYTVYLIALIAFIFSNSLPSIKESAESSGRLLTLINRVLDFFGIPTFATDVFIRKAAHFVEFFVLGASCFGYTLLFKKPNRNTVVNCIFFSCLVAMTDETIQKFSHRGSMLLDVWLDLFAASCAILLFYLVYNIRDKKNNQ